MGHSIAKWDRPSFNHFSNGSKFLLQHLNDNNSNVTIDNNDDEIIISMDIPGIKQQDLKVQVQDNFLVITGTRKSQKKSMEFTRRFSLDNNAVNVSKIKANLSNGVLVVTVQKFEKTSPVDIDITEDEHDNDKEIRADDVA